MTARRTTTLRCTSEIRRLWPRPLAKRWVQEYPDLFDQDDLRLAMNQPRNHFAEWFTAIHLFQRDGVLALVEKYAFQKHRRKLALYASLLNARERAVVEEVCGSFRVQLWVL